MAVCHSTQAHKLRGSPNTDSALWLSAECALFGDHRRVVVLLLLRRLINQRLAVLVIRHRRALLHLRRLLVRRQRSLCDNWFFLLTCFLLHNLPKLATDLIFDNNLI